MNTNGKNPLSHRLEIITPEIAAMMLAANTRNRQLRSHVVARYARDMKNGEWDGRNGETITLCSDGTIINGQHRLTACIQADTPFECLVVRGAAPESYRTVDQGLPRTFRDALHVNGEISTAVLSAALTWMWHWENSTMSTSTCYKPTHAELAVLLEKYPDLRESVAYIGRQKGITRQCAPSACVFCHFHFYKQNPDECERFFQDFSHGANLAAGDPVLALRERLIRGAREGHRPDRSELVALILKAWKFRITGKPVTVLLWRKGEDFPDIWTEKKQRRSGA